jgi:hypothetical protein
MLVVSLIVIVVDRAGISHLIQIVVDTPQPLSSDPDNGRDVESLPVASSHCEPNRRQLVLYRSPSVQYSRSARIIQ